MALQHSQGDAPQPYQPMTRIRCTGSFGDESKLSQVFKVGIDRVFNCLAHLSEIDAPTDDPGKPGSRYEKLMTDEYKSFRAGRHNKIGLHNCSEAITENGFGLLGASFVYWKALYHLGITKCKKTGIEVHTDHSKNHPYYGQWQTAIQCAPETGHLTRLPFVINQQSNRFEHLSYAHYEAFWNWLVQTGRMTPEFLDCLEAGGKVNGWAKLTSDATLDLFYQVCTTKEELQRFKHLQIVFRSPPEELCHGFVVNAGMQIFVVEWQCGLFHAGPLGCRGSKAVRLILFNTMPDNDGCYVSDKGTNATKPRQPLAPGELEAKLELMREQVNNELHKYDPYRPRMVLQLLLGTKDPNSPLSRISVNCVEKIVNQHAYPMPLDHQKIQRELLNTIQDYEKDYMTNELKPKPLRMMDGKSHCHLVRRILSICFTQPSLPAMRAALYAHHETELYASYQPPKRGLAKRLRDQTCCEESSANKRHCLGLTRETAIDVDL